MKANAQSSGAAAPPKALRPLQDSLEAYDRQRPLRVAVLFVHNALTDDLRKSAKPFDFYFTLKEPYPLAAYQHDTVAFRLNDEAVLFVRDLRLALRRYKRHKEDLRLYINDVPLPMVPEQLDTTRARNVALVRFRLVRNSTTEPVWQGFYRIADKLDRHNTSFNIGLVDGQLGQAYGPVNLLLINRFWLRAGFIALGMLVAGCWWLIGHSDFIRTDSSLLLPFAEGALPPGKSVRIPLSISKLYRKVPFSLAKTQTAFWTLLISGAYLMITVVTTALPAIPTGLLGLLGISVANGVFSQLLNRSQADATDPLTKQKSNAQESRGWWADVLTENAGVSLARLQFLVFNFIAGLYFVYYVSTRWAFYDFGSDILALISISSAGFLANKNFENSAKAKDNDTDHKLPSTGSNYTGASDMAAAATRSSLPTGGGTAFATPLPSGDDTLPASEPTTAATSTSSGSAATPTALPATGATAGQVNPGENQPSQEPAALVAPRANAQLPPTPPATEPTAAEQWYTRFQRFMRAPRRFDSNPTGDIFGNPGPAKNGCTLQVGIVATLRGGLDLRATVRCAREPLPSGDVVFLLHPTYEQRALTVPLDEGEAILRFFSVGCFTLIAMLDAGATILSFDLRDVPGAPSSFLAR
ncbi:hypothetical protein GO988_04915 [Hymenobacter sp. HMF4947]|uniref:Uncharacterized protein n=1 Tax=Hymenobacter ginkgonis TaxID=2682976 RepID=A0A7K1TBI1_9BACT|nr:hypothetical protein [Hymenobacter ginkgonis]MVN75662.1 hypothetical protein [Hymenobacter ginkgonis]